ncbi:hypothetical protein J6590_002151 [Homalodisca vitripennis]|nr:hypothetical protein J6590_002151 [Homalodisca vitripennis]
MELSQLPDEMVVAIAAQLTARDVTACSGVSVGWRRAFNLDRVWKPYCSLGPTYFEEDINRVKPTFEIPYNEDSGLEPLCEWRVSFLKEAYVIKNWRCARFMSDEVLLQTSSCLYVMDAVDRFENHWMFLCCTTKEGLKLEVWNIKSVPFLHMSTRMCNIFKNIDETIENDEVNFKLHLCGEKLLFIYDNLVTVYEFCYPHYQLSFLYNFSFVHTAPFFTPRRISHLPDSSLCDVDIVGNLLFGVSYSFGDRIQQFSPSMHVWNIDSAEKVKDHCVFESREEDTFSVPSCLFLSTGDSKNVVVTRTFDGDPVMASRIRAFNSAKFEYTNFYIQLKFTCIWTAVTGNIVVVCELINPLERECIFYFYDVDTSSCKLKTGTYNIYDPEKISSSSSKFAFIDLDSNITVFDILTQQAFVSSLQPTRNRLKTLTMINDQLLLLESKYRGTSRSFENILVTSYEVWDFTKRTKPLRCCLHSHDEI